MPRRHFERPRPVVPSSTKEVFLVSDELVVATVAPQAVHSTSALGSTVMRSRQFERPGALHVPAKDREVVLACGSAGSCESSSPMWGEQFSPGSWGGASGASSQSSPRVHRRPAHPQRVASSPQVCAQLDKDENNSSSSSLAQLAQDDDGERANASSAAQVTGCGSERTSERARSTSIIRQRLGSHLARAATHVGGDLEIDREQRHVSFCADRAGGVEVVQFTVDDGPSPETKRGPRRVFGGELQSHVAGGRAVMVEVRNAGTIGHCQAGHANLERLAPSLIRNHGDLAARAPR